MQTQSLTLSDDQADAIDRVSEALLGHGIDLAEGTTLPMAEGKASVLAVVGKAGSGKTMLLAELYRGLKAAGIDGVYVAFPLDRFGFERFAQGLRGGAGGSRLAGRGVVSQLQA